MEILVFGGTIEGRLLVEWLDARGSCDVVVSTATEYGASLLCEGERVTVLQGPLSPDQKRQLMEEHDFCCLVDATHPYAQHISHSVLQLGHAYRKDVLRIVRDRVTNGPWTVVDDAAEAITLLSQTEGNILLTTGSKDLAMYAELLPDYRTRLFVRVLPITAALAQTEELGIPASHVIAMQGPFTKELNEALMRQLNINWLVTKQSGKAGGFDEKIAAAAALRVKVIALRRPEEPDGVTLEEAKKLLEDQYGL